jgi:hypothetical protein
MKKLAITRKLMIAIRSKRGGRIGGSDAAESDRHARLGLQPIRELLLRICCRCSHRQQSVQFMVAGLGNRQRRLGEPPREIALALRASQWQRVVIASEAKQSRSNDWQTDALPGGQIGCSQLRDTVICPGNAYL